MQRLRIGILGTGTVVRSFHLPALVANPRAQVVALGNLHEASLKSLQAECGIPKAYSDVDQMAADPDIDAVVNALPNSLHAPVTVSMLKHGKHVLCEKPMACTAAGARRMVAASESARRKLMIAHVWRSHPEAQWLRDVVAAGTLGTIERIVGHAVVAGRGPALGSWFLDRDTAGGGALADVGIHVIDKISFLFADRLRPVRVTARTENRYRRLDVEDTASMTIEYDNGMTAQIEAGWYHPEAAAPHGAVELFGSKGYARTLPPKMMRHQGSGAAEPVSDVPVSHPDDNFAIYAAQIDHFFDAIFEDRTPICDGRTGLADMVLLDAAYKSAAAKTSVVPEEI